MMRRSGNSRRAGFALPAVLWVLVGVAALGLADTIAARDATIAAQNRVDHTRAAWNAQGCLEIARAAITIALASPDRGSAPWSNVDSLIFASRDLTDAHCDVTARAAGATVDVNSADAGRLQRTFIAVGMSDRQADSLAEAVLDWRDRDDAPLPSGAEAEWYRERNTMAPRNGPIADVAELRRIRGLEEIPGIDRILGVDADRIPLARAPLAVIASLPGFGAEALARFNEIRVRGEQPTDLLAFAASLSRNARATLLANYPELASLVTSEPDAWIVTSHAAEGTRHVAATIEVRLVRAGTRAAIVRRRTW